MDPTPSREGPANPENYAPNTISEWLDPHVIGFSHSTEMPSNKIDSKFMHLNSAIAIPFVYIKVQMQIPMLDGQSLRFLKF